MSATPEAEVVMPEHREHLPALRQPAELEVSELVARGQKIHAAMKEAMRQDEHYGVIPGTNKPTLLKPGAEKLCSLFLLDPEYDVDQQWQDEHLTATAKCTLYHIPSGNRVASGVGLCSTREKKYAYRQANRNCPTCGAEAIIRGKEEYGGGWVCWKKRDGCGKSFQAGDPAIESQEAGQVPNPDLPDTYNTVLKMACKRALIAAVLNGTAASDVFTQDMEDAAEATPADEMPSEAENASGSTEREARKTIPPRREPAQIPPRTQNLAELDNLFAALAVANPATDWKESAANMSARLFGERDPKNLLAAELDSVVKEVGRWLAQATPADDGAPF